jgi:hypothetical protein
VTIAPATARRLLALRHYLAPPRSLPAGRERRTPPASYLERQGVTPLSAGGTVYSDEQEILDARLLRPKGLGRRPFFAPKTAQSVGRVTQRKPMWLIPVSIIWGRRAAGR